MNPFLVELVRLLAITAQLQIVTAQDLNNQVLFEWAYDNPIEQRAILRTQRQGTLARTQIWAAPQLCGKSAHINTKPKKRRSKSRRGAMF